MLLVCYESCSGCRMYWPTKTVAGMDTLAVMVVMGIAVDMVMAGLEEGMAVAAAAVATNRIKNQS